MLQLSSGQLTVGLYCSSIPMAQSTDFLKRNQEITGVVWLLISVLLLVQTVDAFEFRVGGSRGSWSVPNDTNADFYNQWAGKSRFQVGDSLLFVYASDHDSVLQVTKNDYITCNSSAPLQKFTDGHSVFKLNQSGPYYFISGVTPNCLKNQKLIVVVLADRSKKSANGTVATPPPPPVEEVPTPSPAPNGEEAPPAPPSDKNPATAPSHEDSPPPNGSSHSSSSIVIGSWGILGFFVASSLGFAV